MVKRAKAFCRSDECNPEDQYSGHFVFREVEKEVDYWVVDCQDCGHALFWKLTQPKNHANTLDAEILLCHHDLTNLS